MAKGLVIHPFELVTNLVSLTGDSSVLVMSIKFFSTPSILLSTWPVHWCIYYNSVHSHRTPSSNATPPKLTQILFISIGISTILCWDISMDQPLENEMYHRLHKRRYIIFNAEEKVQYSWQVKFSMPKSQVLLGQKSEVLVSDPRELGTLT